MVEPESTDDIAAMLQQQIDAVRTLPGMRTARAIIIVEANQAFIADNTYIALKRLPRRLANYHYMHLDPHTGNKRAVDGTPANANSEMMPGLSTTARNKPVVLGQIQHLLHEHRLFLHAGLVTYATRNTDYEDRLRHTYDGDVEALCKSVGQSVPHGGAAADLLRVYEAATRARVGALITRQFDNMQEILRYHRVGTIDEFVTVKICGKKAGADPRDSNNKDDIVMALCMAIEGAEAFYWRPEFAAERASVGVQTAPLYGVEAGH